MRNDLLNRRLLKSLPDLDLGEELINNNYMTIEALEDGLTAKLTRTNTQYRIDGSDEWVSLDANTTTPAINAGQTISFKATNPSISSRYGIGTFTISKRCNLKGNCMSLLFGDDAATSTDLSGKNYAFYKLFRSCTKIEKVDKGFLPATVLTSNCYQYMFYGCTSLTQAPKLPVTTLATKCYQYMFYKCTSLTQAPELPATVLAPYCYYYMLSGCSKLNYIKMLATDISASSCLIAWVDGVASTGTFVKNAKMNSLPSGVSGIPSGWTVADE